MCAMRNEREFTHMRYTAATCDPNDFKVSQIAGIQAANFVVVSHGTAVSFLAPIIHWH